MVFRCVAIGPTENRYTSRPKLVQDVAVFGVTIAIEQKSHTIAERAKIACHVGCLVDTTTRNGNNAGGRERQSVFCYPEIVKAADKANFCFPFTHQNGRCQIGLWVSPRLGLYVKLFVGLIGR